MNKKNHFRICLHTKQKIKASYLAMHILFLSSVKMIMNIVLEILKNVTVKFPIAYANIRV